MKIQVTKQENQSVTRFYIILKSLWHELDMFYDLEKEFSS